MTVIQLAICEFEFMDEREVLSAIRYLNSTNDVFWTDPQILRCLGEARSVFVLNFVMF